MKQTVYPVAGGANAPTLQQLVNTIISNYLAVATRANTQVVNEVRAGIPLGASMEKAASVMSAILATVVANSKNGEIHISAERFTDIVVLEIQERNNYNGYALSYSIHTLAPDAAALGGFISIKGPQQKITTISFSFPTNQAA